MPEVPEQLPTLVLASLTELAAALEETNDPVEIKRLSERAAKTADLARRIRCALDEQNRIAELRIRIARKLGMFLATEVHRGGCGSRSPCGMSRRGGASAPLPEGISKMEALRFRRLAEVAEAALVGYLNGARSTGRLITAAGLLRAAADGSPSSSGRAPSAKMTDLLEIVTAARRVMHVEVALGLPVSVRAAAGDLRHFDLDPKVVLRGGVLAFADVDTDLWITRLATAVNVPDVMFVTTVPDTTAWPRALGTAEWTICLPSRGRPLLVAHRGERRHAFYLVFRGMGLVIRTMPG